MTNRRPVRATVQFFEDLDRQLATERGPQGEPSSADFQAFELLDIIEIFAYRFEDLAELIPGRTDYRVLIAAGRLVRAYAVTAQLCADGAVELLSLHVDT